MKKKKGILLILIIIFLLLAALFNPTKEDFNKKIHEISSDGTTNVTYEQVKLLGLEKLYESGYERKNYYIFSIYTTNGSTNTMWTKPTFAGKNVKYIGIFRSLIRIN